MKLYSKSRFALVPLLIAVLVITFALALGAGDALASEGDMSGMPGMTDEEMQQMEQPPAAEADGHGAEAAEADGHEAETAAGPHTDMAGASVNWLVVGGFLVLIAGTTLAAVATKRHLARRMASGELAGAGALDV